MIKSLFIKDFALIDELTVEFQNGLNVLTGQTGAGKSIIIGALNMILGERADTEVIRQGTQKAISEAVMIGSDQPELQGLFEHHKLDWRKGKEIILRREIKSNGSRAFINDSPVTIGVLKEVGDLLVDLHGQHDHQLLLNEDHHRMLLDRFDDVKKPLAEYREQYGKTKEINQQLRELRRKERDLKEKLELHQFQLNELLAAKLDSDEEEDLMREMHLLDNAEVLDQKAQVIAEIGSDGEINILDLVTSLEDALSEMAGIESAFDHYVKELDAARISIQELLRFTDRYRSDIEFNPDRLEELRQRHTELKRLQKKYGRTISGLIAFQEELEEKVDLSTNFDVAIQKKEKEFEEACKDLSGLAKKLRSVRAKVGKFLSKEIQRSLAKLSIEHAEFELVQEPLIQKNGWLKVDGKKLEATEHGGDHIAFYLSTNKGETPKPMAKIASGGEISRVMLALKSVLAHQQSLPVMIFDEIDTGISGEVSTRVGAMMKQLSEACQIIAITHQPQIASKADVHFKVSKHEKSGRTVTDIAQLSEKGHIIEIAALMSGEKITEANLASAREMVEQQF